MTDVSTMSLHRRYAATRSPRDLELLCVRYRGLVAAFARRYARPGLPDEDLRQVASLGLVKALQRFDPDRGCAFTSFAVPTILGELRQFCRQVLWPVHVPRLVQERVAAIRRATNEAVAVAGRPPTVAELATRLQCDEESVLEAMHASRCFVLRSLDADPGGDGQDGGADTDRWLATDELGFEEVEDRAVLEESLSRLTDAERELVRMRFVDELSHREIADRRGVSASQVGRLLEATVERLADASGRRRRSRVRAARRHLVPGRTDAAAA